MSTTIKSRKAKARRLQQQVRDTILNFYPHLSGEDVRSTPMGVQGADIQLSQQARESFPFHVECKAHKSFAVYKDYEQAEKFAGKLTPMVVIKADNKPALAIVDLETFVSCFSVLYGEVDA